MKPAPLPPDRRAAVARTMSLLAALAALGAAGLLAGGCASAPASRGAGIRAAGAGRGGETGERPAPRVTPGAAPERAEVPDAATHDRLLARLSEQLLLAGWRRLLVVGGRPRWQRLLRHGLDARVEVRVAPDGPRSAESASDDVRWADVVVLWDAHVGEAAEQVYALGRPEVVRLQAVTWTAFLHRLGDELARGQG